MPIGFISFLICAISIVASFAVSAQPTTRKSPVAASAKAQTTEDKDCKTSDLNEAADSPFRTIPVYDQGGTGICYAYSSAAMVDFYRMKNKDFSYGLTNPVFAAYSANTTVTGKLGRLVQQSIGIKDLDGGLPNQVMSSLKSKGVCSEKDSEACLETLGGRRSSSHSTVVRQMAGVGAKYRKNISGLPSPKEETPRCEAANGGFDQQTRAVSRFNQSASYDSLNAAFKTCERQKVNTPDFSTHTFLIPGKAVDEMGDSLDKGYPAVYNHCSSLFKTGQSTGSGAVFNVGSAVGLDRLNKECNPHSTLVTGRRKIKGVCSYLVRNSWGAMWMDSGASACACYTLLNQYKAECSRSEAREIVGCWYDKKQVQSHLLATQVYDIKKPEGSKK